MQEWVYLVFNNPGGPDVEVQLDRWYADERARRFTLTEVQFSADPPLPSGEPAELAALYTRWNYLRIYDSRSDDPVKSGSRMTTLGSSPVSLSNPEAAVNATAAWCFEPTSSPVEADHGEAGGMTTYTWLAFTSAMTPLDEPEYNRWYTDVHIPDVLQIPGIVSARRYRLVAYQTPARSETREAGLTRVNDALGRYLVIYTIATSDLRSVFREVEQRSRTQWVISSALNAVRTLTWCYEPIGPSV